MLKGRRETGLKGGEWERQWQDWDQERQFPIVHSYAYKSFGETNTVFFFSFMTLKHSKNLTFENWRQCWDEEKEWKRYYPGVRTESDNNWREERKTVLGSVDRTEMRERQYWNQERIWRQDWGQGSDAVLRARASDRTDIRSARAWDSSKHCPTLCISAEERDKASEHRRVQQGVWLLYCKILGHASVHMRESVCEKQTHLCFSPGSSSVSGVSRGLWLQDALN